MKVSVIFHSVCGNTYTMARAFSKVISENGIDVTLARVEDSDLEELAGTFPIISEKVDEIKTIKIATPQDLLEADLVIIGSPTYFGSMSGEMKLFLDSTAPYWPDAKLAGKRIAAFTTASTAEGGGHLCLNSIITFGMHMGMLPQIVPANLLPGIDIPAYGLISYTGPMADKRPGENEFSAIQAFSELLIGKK